MKDAVKQGFIAAASMIMSCLSVCGIRVTSYVYFENWRRREGCHCKGCQQWQRVQNGKATVEELGQDALKCQYRHIAWRAKSPLQTRWNPVMGMLWIIILGICFLNLYASIGVVAIVTTVGKNDILNQYFTGSAYTAAWFIGLVDGGSTPTYAAGDTMASHAGWTENVGYSNSTRVAWSSAGAASAGSIVNNAAAFNINATGTIAGQFMVTNSTKSGTTGVLYSEASFTQGNRSVVSGDTLNCTATETAS
jgi:hypothetical protein